MRRKSTRNAQKATPEKSVKETESNQKTRRSRRRKRSPSKSSESEDEVLIVTKRGPVEETPDTTTKSHTPTDDETSEEPMWKVTPTTEESPKGEIQKLKLCLTRPSPDSPDKSKSRRSKSNSQTEDDATSSEDKSSSRRTRSQGSPIVRSDGLSSQELDEDGEEKKGKGKSKGKHKSKIEKSPHVSEPELQTNNEISENVQVTPQSPSIDKPVDNENDCKVDVNDKQNINESVQGHEIVDEESVTNESQDFDIVQDSNVKTQTESQTDTQSDKESDDDQPLSVIQTSASESKEKETEAEHQPEIPSKGEESVSETKEDALKQTTPEPEQSTVQSENEKKEDDESSNLEKQELTEESTESSKDTEMNEAKEPSDENQSAEIVSQEETPEEHTIVETIESKQPTDSNIDNNPVETVQEEAPQTAKVPEETASSIKSSVPRRRLKRNNDYVKPNSDEKEETPEQTCSIKPSGAKRKWKNDKNVSALIKLDLESIQAVCPTIDFPEEPDLNLEIEKERRKSITEPNKKLERKVSVEYKSDYTERPSFEKQTSVSSAKDSDDNSNIIAFNRKISIVDDTASKLRPPPSPSKNPVSDILYITNLVRPFTVKQLRELLERTGKIQEEGFWTDRIKSKCYVQYETQEEAEATRNALHGVQWPIGNGKMLIIDYATEEDMKTAKNPPAPPPVAPAPDIKAAIKENMEPMENKSRSEEKISKEVEKKKIEGPVREWDIGKKELRRDRSRSRERTRKHRRSPSPGEDFISRKQRKTEESVPQKLMDDLFLKTKATPSIYWQPLSPEEISMKQQQRLIRMEEHKRRMEENSRMKGRDMGRGAFRRRYD